MPAFIDLSGQTFGEWLVIERTSNTKWGGAKFRCRCSCGTIADVNANTLRQGQSQRCQRCGWKKTHDATRLPWGEAALNHAWGSHIRNAKSRGHCNGLSKSQYLKLILRDCEYCGREPAMVAGGKSSKHVHGQPLINGVDRLEPDLGYHPINCVPCCKSCNTRKKDMTYTNYIRINFQEYK